MYAYIIHRILATIPIMAMVTVFVFLLQHMSPGDPALLLHRV
jgi:peptide/nickel transport system permease protein